LSDRFKISVSTFFYKKHIINSLFHLGKTVQILSV